MTTTSMLPSAIWSRLSPGLQVIVTGGGEVVPTPVPANRVPALRSASGRTSAISSPMHLAVCSIPQSKPKPTTSGAISACDQQNAKIVPVEGVGNHLSGWHPH